MFGRGRETNRDWPDERKSIQGDPRVRGHVERRTKSGAARVSCTPVHPTAWTVPIPHKENWRTRGKDRITIIHENSDHMGDECGPKPISIRKSAPRR